MPYPTALSRETAADAAAAPDASTTEFQLRMSQMVRLLSKLNPQEEDDAPTVGPHSGMFRFTKVCYRCVHMFLWILGLSRCRLKNNKQ